VADTAVVDAHRDVVVAQAMYDENLRRPNLVGLMGWIRLEQRPAGLLSDNPADVLALVVSMASAWSLTSGAYAASAGEPSV